MRRLIEEIDTAVPACLQCQERNGKDPGHPDDPLDDVPLFYLPVSCQEDGLLAPGAGADPAAESPA